MLINAYYSTMAYLFADYGIKFLNYDIFNCRINNMMQRVFVLDHKGEPLMPCHPSRARMLLKKGQAAVFRKYPFTIILKNRIGGIKQPLEAKLDPGSKTSGLALVAEGKNGRKALFAAHLHHRGEQVKSNLEKRRLFRRCRRGRKTRYRQARFNNRKRLPDGSLLLLGLEYLILLFG